ncbi:MAG: VTT domain-containing protein [Fimbriimonadaceae bacterium]|nr:VTT domain-containing protein [Fimbriimonadaceae bacterium]
MLDFIQNIPEELKDVVKMYGFWTYGILFLIVFAETGLVIAPFLPGDSLIFAAGVVAANQEVDISVVMLWVIFITAAFCGDNVNYTIGRYFGPRLFKHEHAKIFKPSNLQKTREFMEKHGRWAILVARFVPFMRTYVPFTAGLSRMNYRNYISYSVSSAIIWVTVCLFPGYFLGKIPFVRENFEVAIYVIIGFAVGPILIHALITILKRKKAAKLAQKQSTVTPSEEPSKAEALSVDSVSGE